LKAALAVIAVGLGFRAEGLGLKAALAVIAVMSTLDGLGLRV